MRERIRDQIDVTAMQNPYKGKCLAGERGRKQDLRMMKENRMRGRGRARQREDGLASGSNCNIVTSANPAFNCLT